MSDLPQDHLSQKFQDAIDVIQWDTSHLHYGTECKYYETLESHIPAEPPSGFCYPSNLMPDVPRPVCNWGESSYSHAAPNFPDTSATDFEAPQMYPVFTSRQSGKGRKKLRLYEYLHEALHDVNMADSIQWADRSAGTFHFVSKNKERLAESWGKRKGNRKTMTYQKMARALRNYSRTGEIIKIRRKLTYQFNPAILQRLSSGHTHGHVQGHAPHDAVYHQCTPSEQVYYEMLPPDWHSWYGHYSSDNDYDPTFRLG